MTFRRRFKLSEQQRNDMWRRWKAGQSLHEIGRTFGKDHVSIQLMLAQHGGIAPSARRRSPLTLTLAERENISRGIACGSSIREIARGLQRAVSDRGVQYACGDYVQVLRNHRIILSMSRPGNPYDNASCESFMKTLQQEEIYAIDYRDLEHLVESVEAFVEHYHNRRRLHSALGSRPPEEFEGKSGGEAVRLILRPRK